MPAYNLANTCMGEVALSDHEHNTPPLADLSVATFTNALASRDAAPGGGAATALTGALAAALAAMVARLTLGRPRYAAHQAEMSVLLDTADALQIKLLALMDRDARVFREVMAAYAMPKATPSQVARRTGAIQTALRRATETPLETAGLCLEALQLAGAAVAGGNRNASSDAIVGALLAHAGLRGAVHSAATNLGLIHDAHFCQQTEQRLAALLAAGEAALAQALAVPRAST